MQDEDETKALLKKKKKKYVIGLIIIYSLPVLPVLFAVLFKDFYDWALQDVSIAPLYLIVPALFLFAVIFHVLQGYLLLKKESEPLQEWRRIRARCTRYSSFYFDPVKALYYCAACSDIGSRAVVMKEEAHCIDCPNSNVCGNHMTAKPGHEEIVKKMTGGE
jgi:hypothetical protein